MSEKPPSRPIDMERALLDPGAVFDAPEEVRDHPGIEHGRKIEILRRWEYDVAEISVAEEEGMPPREGQDLLRRIMLALQQLTGGVDVEHVGPSKQHGLTDDTGETE